MGAAMRYQPQGLARLGLLGRGAQSVISGATQIDLVSGKQLQSGGSATPVRRSTPAGIALSFRKNYYVESGAQQAIGTQTFVEFWYGYPSSDQGNQGNGAADPTFLTGSSVNNSAIVGYIGSSRGSSNWGALYNWTNGTALQFNNAGEVLPPDVLTLLVVVRRQSGMEFWRNGRLVTSISQAPVSLAASTFILGSFIESAFWTSSSDALLAGRIVADWTPDQVRAFSANPWQLFDAGSSSSAYQSAIASAAASGGTSAPTTISATLASIAVSGRTAAVVTPTVIAAAVGSTSNAGQKSSVSLPTTLACTTAGEALSGQQASVVLPVTVACSVGAASVAGLVAQVPTATVISAATAGVTASGQAASVGTGSGIACATAGVQAFGLTAGIVIPAVISCTRAASSASGLTASVSTPTVIGCANAGVIARALPSTIALAAVTGIDPLKISASRTVNFGGGTNRVNFDGGTNRVDF